MAFDDDPALVFPSYSSDGTTISIDIADLTGLTVAHAHTTTGDSREILKAIIQTALDQREALAAADRSSKFKIYPDVQPGETTDARIKKTIFEEVLDGVYTLQDE